MEGTWPPRSSFFLSHSLFRSLIAIVVDLVDVAHVFCDHMECDADTQILLDSGANLHVCPRDCNPPGSVDHRISFFQQASAVNVQGHRDRLDTEREIRLHMGSLDFTHTTYVSGTIDNIIISMGSLLDAGATVHSPVMEAGSLDGGWTYV